MKQGQVIQRFTVDRCSREAAGAPNDQFVVKCIIIPQLMKINVLKAFSGFFSVAGKKLSVPFTQQDTQEISQPAR